MTKTSAGLLMYRHNTQNEIEVFLVHPGGPFWAKKDIWSIPKGEYDEKAEDPLMAAKREFEEETNCKPNSDNFIPLSFCTYPTEKIVTAWAFEGDFDPALFKSNTFLLEWPPRSGKKQEFPEVDKGEWFSIEEAKIKLNPAQVVFVERLEKILKEKE